MDRDTLEEKIPLKPCPSCPDGYVWTSNGQTGKTCPTCKGYAVVHLNGDPLTKQEQEARYG